MFRPEPKVTLEVETSEDATAIVYVEDLMEKLKILNYESDLLKKLKMKPFNRHYFMVPTNPGEQFYIFSSLAAWLIRKTGKSFEQPQEYDDPNSTITSILDVLRQIGMSVDFPPSRLKQGVGYHVVLVLDKLADQALRISNFSWHKPEIQADPELEPETIEDDSEIILDRVEEEMATAYSDSDDEQILLDLGQANSTLEGSKKTLKRQGSSEKLSLTNIEEPNSLGNSIDTEAWRLELERVLPQLKVIIKADPRDWRFRLEQMKNYREEIKNGLSSTKEQLDKLHVDITSAMEKIDSREKYLNSNLEGLVEEYGHLYDQVSTVKAELKTATTQVQEQTNQLTQLSADLEDIKHKTEQRGFSMNDTTPVTNIKKAIATMKQEMSDMEVDIGVMQHTLMHANLEQTKPDSSSEDSIKFSSAIYVK